jgi:hypothetical protein
VRFFEVAPRAGEVALPEGDFRLLQGDIGEPIGSAWPRVDRGGERGLGAPSRLIGSNPSDRQAERAATNLWDSW